MVFLLLDIYLLIILSYRSTPEEQNDTGSDMAVAHRRLNNQICSNSSQMPNVSQIQWRHSDSHYGFRTGPSDACRSSVFSNIYPYIHHQHMIPQMAHNHHQLLSSLRLANNSTSYVPGQNDGFGIPCNRPRHAVVPTCNQGPDYHNAIMNANLPRHMWGPPPPYSQPVSMENVNSAETTPNELPAISRSADNNQLEITESIASGVSPSITTQRLVVNSDDSPNRNNFDQPNLTRTTKSGILLSPSQGNVGSPTKDLAANEASTSPLDKEANQDLNRRSAPGSIKLSNGYDDSVHSAMHIYEQAKQKGNIIDSEINDCSNEISSNSLPLRRIRKRLDLAICKSEANISNAASIEEKNLVKEVRQKLNELGLYKYQRSKAARELAEIRQALSNLQNPTIAQSHLRPSLSPSQLSKTEYMKQCMHKQSLPLPPLPIPSANSNINVSNQVYQAPSIVSSACSTTENKYETIGKSINPYKINSNDKTDDGTSSHTSSPSECTYGFIASSISPMSIQTNKSSLGIAGIVDDETTSDASDTSPSTQNSEEQDLNNKKSHFHKAYKCFTKKDSSHYAQISPLRGQGAPTISSTGLSLQDNSNSAFSYFRVKIFKHSFRSHNQ